MHVVGPRRLTLNRELLATLTSDDLAHVAGGTVRTIECELGTARGCPTISPEWCHTILSPECLAG